MNRVRSEKENQNSRTFQWLFTVFQESFFIDSNSPNTVYMQGFCPIQIVNAFTFRAHFFCLISAPRIVSARYFRFWLSRFSLCKVSLPVAFDSYYLHQIEQNRIPWLHHRWIRHHTLFSTTDFAILLIFFCTLHPKNNCFYHFQRLLAIIKEIFSKFKDNSRTNCTFFRIPGVFQDQGHFQGLFKVCANPDEDPFLSSLFYLLDHFINQPWYKWQESIRMYPSVRSHSDWDVI